MRGKLSRMTLHLTSHSPTAAARSLDDRHLNAACQLSVRVASRVIRRWCGDEYADAHGCYRMSAPRVWVEWAACDQRHLWRMLAYADAFLREWLLRRGKAHGSTRGLAAVLGAVNRMEAPAPQLSGLMQPPPYVGPQGYHGRGTVYDAYASWLSAKWDRAAKQNTPPVWSSRSAPGWYDGLMMEVWG